jgi:hypothetical protein
MMRSRSETEGWLRHTLKDGDTMDGKRLKGLASDSGIKERTLYRAAQAIGVTMLPGGFGKPRRWHLCPMSAKGCHVCLTKTNGEQAKGGRHVEPGAVAKVKPTDSELKERLARAKMATRPEVRAAFLISEFGGHPDVAALAVQLEIGMNDICNNDLRSCEAVLYGQAHALQAIFVELARQAAFQVKGEGWFPNYEAHMRLALKAQSNCRATLETLAAMKNPPVVVARQANIAQGPQQVNNGMMPAGEPRAGARKTEKRQNKLSGGSNELLPDLRTPGAAISSDPATATVGTFDRAKVRRR